MRQYRDNRVIIAAVVKCQPINLLNICHILQQNRGCRGIITVEAFEKIDTHKL